LIVLEERLEVEVIGGDVETWRVLERWEAESEDIMRVGASRGKRIQRQVHLEADPS
jgi:hypothetical protein